jgi:predicted enzyme related to lactoylglutathione lyase
MTTIHRPIWVDNSSRDPVANRAFYARLFGWSLDTNDDPQYGGYTIAKLEGKDVAGFGGQADPSMPASLWNLYIGTSDAAATVAKATAAGGTVVVPPFPIGTMGTSAFIADPTGAVFGLWQAAGMSGFGYRGTNGFGWAELNARGVGNAVPFYERTFGWTRRTSDMGNGTTYTELLDGEESLVGAVEMSAQLPPQVPSYWMTYFAVDDVARVHDAAVAAGGTSMMPATPFPGGTFAILTDAQGGTFGLLKTAG